MSNNIKKKFKERQEAKYKQPLITYIQNLCNVDSGENQFRIFCHLHAKYDNSMIKFSIT